MPQNFGRTSNPAGLWACFFARLGPTVSSPAAGRTPLGEGGKFQQSPSSRQPAGTPRSLRNSLDQTTSSSTGSSLQGKFLVVAARLIPGLGLKAQRHSMETSAIIPMFRHRPFPWSTPPHRKLRKYLWGEASFFFLLFGPGCPKVGPTFLQVRFRLMFMLCAI